MKVHFYKLILFFALATPALCFASEKPSKEDIEEARKAGPSASLAQEDPEPSCDKNCEALWDREALASDFAYTMTTFLLLSCVDLFGEDEVHTINFQNMISIAGPYGPLLFLTLVEEIARALRYKNENIHIEPRAIITRVIERAVFFTLLNILWTEGFYMPLMIEPVCPQPLGDGLNSTALTTTVAPLTSTNPGTADLSRACHMNRFWKGPANGFMIFLTRFFERMVAISIGYDWDNNTKVYEKLREAFTCYYSRTKRKEEES